MAFTFRRKTLTFTAFLFSPDGDEDDAIKNWYSTIDQEFKAPKVYTTKHVPMQSSLRWD